jgi:LAO/AO transport system kinase
MLNRNYRHTTKINTKAVTLAEGVLAADRSALSRAITLCESKKTSDRQMANEILEKCLPSSGNSIRIGLTGVPGVGKSTFIESFGNLIIEKYQKKVAVLAVDPSSSLSRGSILGDKTRMEKLSQSAEAFIRPSPTGGALGGLTNSSREAIILCEAAGYEVILIETVGVGQSETDVRKMCDFFLLLMLPGAGDELQGIKRGIMEMADGIFINKAEEKSLTEAKIARKNYKNALHLFPPAPSGWTPQVKIGSALQGTGLEECWRMIREYEKHCRANHYFEKQRKAQLKDWFEEQVEKQLQALIHSDEKKKSHYLRLEASVLKQELSPLEAARQLMKKVKFS